MKIAGGMSYEHFLSFPEKPFILISVERVKSVLDRILKISYSPI